MEAEAFKAVEAEDDWTDDEKMVLAVEKAICDALTAGGVPLNETTVATMMMLAVRHMRETFNHHPGRVLGYTLSLLSASGVRVKVTHQHPPGQHCEECGEPL